MTPISEFNRKHLETWKRLRAKIFGISINNERMALAPRDDYIELVKTVANDLVKGSWDLELLKLALKEIGQNFAFGNGTTQGEEIYHNAAYALDYGLRSFLSVQTGMLEYFIDPSRGRMEDRIEILDIGTGTGAALFGTVDFLSKYCQYNDLARSSLRKVTVTWIEKDPGRYLFCDKLCEYLKNKEEYFRLEFNPINMDMCDFLKRNELGKYDIILASKSISELGYVQENKWRELNDNILNPILTCLDNDGIFILVEDAQSNKELISHVREGVEFANASIYSPCESGCSQSDCWGWRDYRYKEPAEISALRDSQKDSEKFYLLLISHLAHHISKDIIQYFLQPGMGNIEYRGLFSPNTVTCLSRKIMYYDISQDLRGRMLFQNGEGKLFLYGLDFPNYWVVPQFS